MDLLALALLAAEPGSDPGSAVGIFRFFAAIVLLFCIYIGAWSFTYWISKDE